MEALRVLPVVAAAYAAGTLSGGQVRAIVAIVREALRPRFAEIEADMVPLLGELDVEDTIRVLREWVARAEAEVDDPEPAAESDHVHFSPTLGNTFKLDGVLSGDDAVKFGAALTDCLPEVVEGEPVLSLSQRQAIALVEMARRVLQAGQIPVRRQVDVTLIISPDELAGGIARYANGTIVPADRVQRLLCDAVITPIVTGAAGQPLWMGRAIRTATNSQWRALVARDRHCGFPGCHRPSGWCEAHHIREYDRDHGPTDINNLMLLCSHHHKQVHKPGWSARMHPDTQQVEIVTPTGRVLTQPSPHDALAVAAGKPVTRPKTQPRLMPTHRQRHLPNQRPPRRPVTTASARLARRAARCNNTTTAQSVKARLVGW